MFLLFKLLILSHIDYKKDFQGKVDFAMKNSSHYMKDSISANLQIFKML